MAGLDSRIDSLLNAFHAVEKRNDVDVIRTLTALKAAFLKLPFYNTYMETLGWVDMYLAAPE